MFPPSKVDGLLARLTGGPGAAAARMQLAAMGVAAAWRMGRWELLQEYLSLVEDGWEVAGLSQQDEWELCMGALLAALHAGNVDGVRSGLVHARRDILAILPAISQESYTRAYPQLAKLAMLQELEVS
ncbi:hypothetical protein DUNSADRAFT_6362 [Dunaliella salina]|uniref:PIK-related kinase FAT domain-containing protein n=1 Tax=Dunaliella salina TaxID=3046 RepID=A0ABQ7FUS0_DUNSA|nr:hypothetical protein DUNSADRAFT_6362 [Dunaliella salina]|eukprot:KAF5825851.1 hypothetical protein DUNSADRAFT_6362 [Dunaliella salina]